MNHPVTCGLLLVLLAGGLVIAPVGAADAAAQPVPAVAPDAAERAHHEALAAIFIETRVLAMARAALLAQVKPGYERRLVEYYFRTHGDNDLAGAYARTVAPAISPLDSTAALRLARLPQMRAMMAEYELLARQNPANMAPTPTIARLAGEVQRVANAADVQAMGRVTPHSKGLAPFLARQIREQNNVLARQFRARVAEMVQLSWRSDLQAEQIARGGLGVASLDRVLAVWAGSLERSAAALAAQREGYARLGFSTLLEAQYMTNRAGIERARTMVDEAERINQTYLSTVQEIYASRIEQLRVALQELPGYAENNTDATVSDKLGFLIELNETRQRGYAAYRRMLAFAESRIGSTSQQGEQLVFDTQADLLLWREMDAEVQRLRAQDGEKNAALLQREGQAPPPNAR